MKIFIFNNYLGKTTFELTSLLNQTFNSNIARNTIISFKKKNKLRSGIITKFPPNTKPHNIKPIGYEFVNSQGYTMIKTEENKWELKHHYIYKNKTGGGIPKGYSIIFGDSNNKNFDIDNLILVRVKDKLTAKNKHLLFKDVNTTKTGILIARLLNDTACLRKERKNDRKINNI